MRLFAGGAASQFGGSGIAGPVFISDVFAPHGAALAVEANWPDDPVMAVAELRLSAQDQRMVEREVRRAGCFVADSVKKEAVMRVVRIPVEAHPMYLIVAGVGADPGKPLSRKKFAAITAVTMMEAYDVLDIHPDLRCKREDMDIGWERRYSEAAEAWQSVFRRR